MTTVLVLGQYSRTARELGADSSVEPVENGRGESKSRNSYCLNHPTSSAFGVIEKLYAICVDQKKMTGLISARLLLDH